jgi:FlaA1/EpsC-like NDP-sugar epimerase
MDKTKNINKATHKKYKVIKWKFRYILLMLVDFCFFSLSNFAICYLTRGGMIADTLYGEDIALSITHIIFVGAFAVAINYVLGLYKNVLTFTNTNELAKCLIAPAIQTTFLYLTDRVIWPVVFKSNGTLEAYAYVLNFILLTFLLILPRFLIRLVNQFVKMKPAIGKKNERVMIVGAGFMGNFVIDALRNDLYKNGKPVVVVDDNPAKIGKTINDVKIVGNCSQIPELVKKYNIDQVIICVPSATKKRQKEIIEIAMKTNATLKISPSVEEMLQEGGDLKVRKVSISDLLSRPEVTLDKKVCRYLIGKTILITGAGGSIGSELCKQVSRYSPATIVIFDIYENCAFELANELNNKYKGAIDIKVRIGSIRDIDRLREVFGEFQPDVVFHAAAHKHVPLMEDSPCEAVKNNVFGTYNVALVADEFNVKKMVTLSTDKAVNPTNVMGCTKRITEMIIQYMNTKSKTEYVAVRFGNVLGSHGSVIPIFKKQIQNGGPVTITHPDITRYFMTIPEAAQLVCQAGGLANGGEVFVLDMGEPVKIMDLAENLIRLSGFTTDEIEIKVTGLRPGEKLYEELAMDEEIKTRQKTANEKIFVNKPMKINDKQFEKMLNSLKEINNNNIREKLMEIVPNYHPANNN